MPEIVGEDNRFVKTEPTGLVALGEELDIWDALSHRHHANSAHLHFETGGGSWL